MITLFNIAVKSIACAIKINWSLLPDNVDLTRLIYRKWIRVFWRFRLRTESIE